MDYTVTIKAHQMNEPVLLISEELSEKLKIIKKKKGFVSFGTQKSYIDIQVSCNLEESEIHLPAQIIKNLHIPEYLNYEVIARGNEIMLGPCIGILASIKYEDITKRRLKEITMNTMAYSRIHGAVIAFSLDKVNRSKRLIEGYCYDAEKDNWTEGVFPYPLAIYKRAHINDKWKNHFLSVIGDKVFSNFSFGKWEMYRWFSSEPELLDYLPETKVYNSREDILYMLEKYKVVYIKPIWGMKGFGVVKTSKENQKFIFEYREDGVNRTITAYSPQEFDEVTEKLFEPENHIIQRGLQLADYEGGIVDFRCVMQKDENFRWLCNGIIARIGAKESVVSNISSGGSAVPGTEFISELLSFSESETFNFKERMISLCTKVCKKLDDYGFNFATLGLDLGIDKNKNIWLIEVNNRNPHPAIALRANDIPAYYTILAAPLYYAKSLAGFGPKEECSDVL